jgi:hypothetical protein
MGAQGTAAVDFGAFPGTTDASTVITGQATIGAGSLVEAWLYPVATADHSVDEHIVETIRVLAHTVVPGTGFTITARSDLQEMDPAGRAGRLYGLWSVGWVWN